MKERPRASADPELTTEDNDTPITDGMLVFNYYDMEWGRVEFITTIPECEHLIGTKADGWFKVNGTLLNGVRVSTVDPTGKIPRPTPEQEELDRIERAERGRLILAAMEEES